MVLRKRPRRAKIRADGIVITVTASETARSVALSRLPPRRIRPSGVEKHSGSCVFFPSRLLVFVCFYVNECVGSVTDVNE
jgi:hypothetical protein